MLGDEVIETLCCDFFANTTISAKMLGLLWIQLSTSCCRPQVLPFNQREHAEGFVRGFGGIVVTYTEAMEKSLDKWKKAKAVVNMNKYVLRNILILCSIIFILTIPQGVFAHAFLEKATPAPDSQLQFPPKEIVLVFNERLEKELYSIKVFNEDGDMVSETKTEISKTKNLKASFAISS